MSQPEATSAPPTTVAIVGAGIGSEHLEAYLSLPGMFRVKYVCDVDLGRAGDAIEGRGAADAEPIADMSVALGDGEVDIVDVCLPPHMHLDAMTKALAAGKHAMCEKPLVTSLGDMDSLEGACDSSGGDVFPVMQYRFFPGPRRLASLAASGLAGRLYAASIETHWNRGAEYYATKWRGKLGTEGGGAVMSQAIHAHYLLDMILGPISSVKAWTATRVNDVETEDCASVAFRLESGALATSSVTLGASGDDSRFRACFENVTVESGSDPYYGTDDWRFMPRGDTSEEKIRRATEIADETRFGFAGLFTEVRGKLLGLENEAPTLADARRTVEVFSAIYQSARGGEAVSLPIGKGFPLYDSLHPDG